MDRRQFLSQSVALLGVAVVPVACGKVSSTGHDMSSM